MQRSPAVEIASTAISTGRNESASGSISHESNATAGIRKTATWALDASAISAASLMFPRARDHHGTPVLGGVADDRDDHGGDEELREPDVRRELVDRPDEDLCDQRGNGGCGTEDEQGRSQ